MWVALFYIWSMALGATIGSFLITIWDRWKEGITVWDKKAPWSTCLCCKTRLMAGDIVPIVSYIRSKGRCKYCGVPIGKSSLFLEVMGLLSGLIVAVLIVR